MHVAEAAASSAASPVLGRAFIRAAPCPFPGVGRGRSVGQIAIPIWGEKTAESPMLDIPAAAKPETKSAELVDKQLFRLFPTPLFTGKLPDLTICDRIEKTLRDLHRADQANRTLVAARQRVYMTRDDIHTLPAMRELVEVILRESAQILDMYAIKRDGHYITNMWANIAHPNRRHSMHMHPNCLFAGLVYIKAPKNCGPTVFASPRQLAKNLEPTYLQKNEFNADIFVMPAEKGRMLMWPSHVPHAVEEGTADEMQDRIVVAFNIMIRGRSEISTAAINFA
jgi:uncharacterized protein (TIGR02466 family)